MNPDGESADRTVSGPATTAPAGTGTDWHALPTDQVRALFGTGDRGLTSAQAAQRRRRYGPNQLAEPPPPSAVAVFLRQFRSPLIYILVAATGVTLLLREFLDALVIAVAVLINSAIGFVQERRAERAVRALTRLVVPRARVVRDGHEQEIDSRELVPGDLVLLESGARVPADLRLLRANALELDESLLTGESSPVFKQADPVPAGTPLADRRSMAYTGAVVTSGRGHGVVVATGERTELGAVAGLVRQAEADATPLQLRMGRFARLIVVAVLVGAAVAFGSGLALGGTVSEMFLAAVALAVAAVPEGLPIAVTVAMALGVHRMARRRAIVRRLPAVEALGSTTVIGSDKTGTLTENRMTVQEIWAGGRFHPAGEPAEPGSPLYQTLLVGVLTNEAEAFYDQRGELSGTGDPTEVALLAAAMSAGLVPDELRDDCPLLAEIPFEPRRRYSASIRLVDGVPVSYVKGAPERVLRMCDRMLTVDGEVRLDRAVVDDAAARLAARGLRVLAMAVGTAPAPVRAGRPTPAGDGLTTPDGDGPSTSDGDGRPSDGDGPGPVADRDPDGLVLVGLQGMLDPPRPGVAEAIATSRGAGIRVVMITGDHAGTARAMAERLGLAGPGDEVMTGDELAGLDEARLRERVGRVTVFARATPADKLRVVRALQHNGEVVAVTGDGVNDAPALRSAAIGVAMGRGGTEVAREAADIVLADDNFASIVAAVEEGRVTFDNIRKVSFFLVSAAAATILTILIGIWLRWPLVMLPAQLLWFNLVTSGLQDVALAFEPGERGLLRRPPRPRDEGVISRVLWWRTGVSGVVMAAGTLLMFDWELRRSGSVTSAQTVALTTMVVFMALQVGNARTEQRSVFQVSPLANRFLLLTTAVALAVHIGALYAPPTRWLLRVEPIDAAAWWRIVVVALSVIVVVEVDKWLRRRWVAGRAGAG